jgi:predicted flavoprotein YhiN
MKRIAIIGAGACGLWTALALAKSKQRFAIDIFERFDNVGKKIAMSGNSRGNLGNINQI